MCPCMVWTILFAGATRADTNSVTSAGSNVKHIRTYNRVEALWLTDIINCHHSEKLWHVLHSYGPPLWSSDQRSWLQIQRSGLDSRRYHIFWEVVSLERGLLSLGSTTEELLGRKSSGSGLEIREYGRRGYAALTTDITLTEKVGTNFADNCWLFGRYSSLADWGHRVCFVCFSVAAAV
jgi:hypothetical protein